MPLSVYRCDTLLRLDKLALRTCVIHACLPAGLERIFLGQGALQIHLFNWTVARTVGEQYNTCAYLLTTPILPDMTHSACCLLYVCIGARVIDTPNLPHAPRIRAPTITINILLNMHLRMQWQSCLFRDGLGAATLEVKHQPPRANHQRAIGP